MLQRLLPWLGALALSLALATPATAQDDPQVDPDSPAGTEYQLPTDRAREEAGGGGASRTGGGAGGEAPLFGAGVKAKQSDSARQSGSAKQSGSSSRGGTSTPQAGEQPDLGTSTPDAVRAQAPAPDGGGSGLLAIGAGAGGVLVIGGLAGLLWRRRVSP